MNNLKKLVFGLIRLSRSFLLPGLTRKGLTVLGKKQFDPSRGVELREAVAVEVAIYTVGGDCPTPESLVDSAELREIFAAGWQLGGEHIVTLAAEALVKNPRTAPLCLIGLGWCPWSYDYRQGPESYSFFVHDTVSGEAGPKKMRRTRKGYALEPIHSVVLYRA